MRTIPMTDDLTDDDPTVGYLDWKDKRIVDYGFIWRRATAIDNMNWWLFEKPPSTIAPG